MRKSRIGVSLEKNGRGDGVATMAMRPALSINDRDLERPGFSTLWEAFPQVETRGSQGEASPRLWTSRTGTSCATTGGGFLGRASPCLDGVSVKCLEKRSLFFG